MVVSHSLRAYFPQGNCITIWETEKGPEERVSDMKKIEKELLCFVCFCVSVLHIHKRRKYKIKLLKIKNIHCSISVI